MADELEVIRCADADEWDAWLAEHHGRTEGVWLDIAKLRSGVPSVTSDEAVDVGLCWGWISGHRKALDESWFRQRYTPRPATRQLVGGQRGQGRGPHGGWPDASTWPGRGRRRQGRRPLGPGVGSRLIPSTLW